MPDANLALHRLALQNIRRKPYRNLGLAFLVGLFSAILFGGSVLNSQLSRGLESLSERLGADILIVPYGYERTAMAALLRGEPSTYYMPQEALDKIRDIPGVAAATPQIFLASLSSACCAEEVQIIGFDPESDFLIWPWMKNKIDQFKANEIVVGSKINAKVGDEIFFFGSLYRVAALMEATGLGLDTSVFMPLSALYELMRNNQQLARQFDVPERHISAVAVKVAADLPPKAVGQAIMQACAIEYNLDQVLSENIVNETSRRLHSLSSAVHWAAAGLWALAILVISLVFSVAVSERKHELSLYRLLGARRSWLAKLLLWETFLICAGGATAGLLLAACIVFPFNTLIFSSLNLPHLGLAGGLIAGQALLALAIAVVSGPLACVNTVLSITRSDVYGALREGE
ncbi:MAG: ABC transporter permease [Candidatus Adiutrix sp.]|jgi:putative ABC transport system permease protein|nr:ABC transporter permease [Candidatus Adiutrix sp.]